MNRARILVVDDEPGMLRAVERVLAANYDTLAVLSPDEALAQIPAFEPELALVDVRLPGMTGFDLMDRLRGVRPGLDVILMTGSVSETDATHVEAILRKAFYFIQKPFDRRVLLTLVERCLELRRLEADNRRYVERLERELGEARAFQQGLLPADQARFGEVSIAARSIPSAELGGDFFDYADAGAGRVALLVSDVAGHGASAAMLTGIVKSAFESSRADDFAPTVAVRRVAEGLRGFDPRRFVTVLCARLDPRGGSIEWVNAGHPAGVLWGPNRPPETLDPTGLIVSPVFADRTWQSRSLPLHPGDQVLLHTDGLTELERDDVHFGNERILQVISRHPRRCAELVADLEAEARRFAELPAMDDVTILVASVGGAGST